MEDFFQAKGTLESVVENFPLEYIREQASDKLVEVQQMESNTVAPEVDEPDTLSIDN